MLRSSEGQILRLRSFRVQLAKSMLVQSHLKFKCQGLSKVRQTSESKVKLKVVSSLDFNLRPLSLQGHIKVKGKCH